MRADNMPSCEEEIATIEGLDDAFLEPVEIYNLIDYRASMGVISYSIIILFM